MSREKEVPTGYQITVANIFTIGTKVMSDYFISFQSQSTDSKWTSPLVHGKITKDNRDYPWTFMVDTSQLIVNFHEFDDKQQTDRIIGSTPLLLLKKEGEQQFLVFGSVKQNQGRKVAEIEIEYVQSTVIKQVPSSTSNKKSNHIDSNQNKRTSIDNTIYMENYGQNDNSIVETPKGRGLNIIPEESEHDNFKDSMMRRDQVNDDKFDTLIEDQRVASPSNLETLKVETNRNKFVGEDSNIQLNILKEIQDTADRWYRSNFGKDKPGNLQNYDFQNNQNSRILTVQYQKDFEYLNELSFTNPHMQLKNIIINSDKKPKVIEIYGLDLDSSTVQKRKIATIQSPDGYKKDWNNVIRLPKDKKAYGIEIITKEKERLQGLIIRESNYCKNKTDIYSKYGKKVGNATFNLKQVKKIEIQTLELVDEKPQIDELPLEKEENQLDKSFIKSFENRISQDKVSNVLLNEPYIEAGTGYHSEKPKAMKSQLMNQVYMNRSEDSEQPLERSASASRQKEGSTYKQRQKTKKSQKGISNKPYLNKMESNPLGNKHTSFRKNRFQPVVPATQQYQMTKTPSEQTSHAYEKHPKTEQSLLPSSNQKIDTPVKSKTSKKQSSGNSSNEFLKHYVPEPIEGKISPTASSKISILPHSASKQLRNKIDEIKKMGQDLSKFAKVFPSNKLNKNLKYKTVIYHDDEEDNAYQENNRRNSPSHNSDAQSTSHKKTYREPINATPTFQTIFHKPTDEQKIEKLKMSIAKLEKERLSVHEEVPKRKEPTFLANDDLILIKPKKPQLRIETDHHDDQQDSPIKKQTRKTNLSAAAEAIIEAQRQKEAQSNRAMEEAATIRLARQKQITELGVNTERMAIVNNILQSSYVPTTPTQKRTSPQPIKELSPIDRDKWEKQSLKEELGSFFDSVLNENNHQHKTKYSSQTIQPTTQQIKRFNFLINTISVNYNESAFGGKFVKICIPNKHTYITEVSHSHLNWKCSGFLFNNISEHEDLYVQLYNDPHNSQEQLGRAIIPSTQFKSRKNQSIIRSFLTKQNKVIGEVVIGYQPATTNIMLMQKELPKKRHTSIDYKTIEEPEGIRPSEKETTPIRKGKKGKRNKSSGDSLTEFLKMNRKEKINRYIVNEYSRANIESRINPIRMKKYTAGKNITIGRDVRFPFSAEDEFYKDVPGPGTYEAKSEFKRYRHGQQLHPK